MLHLSATKVTNPFAPELRVEKRVHKSELWVQLALIGSVLLSVVELPQDVLEVEVNDCIVQILSGS